MGRGYNEADVRRSDEDETGTTTSADDERIIYFAGEVSESNVSAAIAAMFAMAKKDAKKPIYLVVETYGGSVDSMFSLYDAMKFVPCPVHTIALGKVMSAGVLILAAGHKGERMIAPHARVMTHHAWTYVVGNVFQIKHELEEVNRQEELWDEAMVRETGKDMKTIKELNSWHFDKYLTPQQCIELGIADKLLYEVPEVVTKAAAKATRRRTSRGDS